MKKLIKSGVCGTREQYISHCLWLKSQQYAAEKKKKKKRRKTWTQTWDVESKHTLNSLSAIFYHRPYHQNMGAPIQPQQPWLVPCNPMDPTLAPKVREIFPPEWLRQLSPPRPRQSWMLHTDQGLLYTHLLMQILWGAEKNPK